MGRLVTALFVVWLVTGQTNVMAAGEDCTPGLLAFREKYGSDPRKIEITQQEQLDYLSSIESNDCLNNGFYILHKADLIMFRRNFEEALRMLDKALQQKLEPRALLLDQKASILLHLKTSDVGNVTESLDDINAMLVEALELETKSPDKSAISSIRYSMTELAYAKGDYDTASQILNDTFASGKALPSVFYTFAGVIAAKQKKWNESVKFMEKAIKINNENYLDEPETIRAMAEAFCQLKRKDLSEKAIALAMAANPQFASFPDILTAQEEIKRCPNPNLDAQAQPSVK